MITRINKCEEVKEAIQYIGTNYKITPYFYVNIVKYGMGTDKVFTWIDRNNYNQIEGLYLLYYDCIHFFTNSIDDYPMSRLVNFIQNTNHKVIMLQGAIGDRVEDSLRGYYFEKNYIIDMDKVGLEGKEYKSRIADRDDISEIVDLLMADPEYNNVYNKRTLLDQLYDRFDGGFSRFFIVKINGKVVATCSTYGEVPGFALVGGVVVHPDYRRKGLAGDVENYACHVLAKEGISKVGFVNYNNDPSIALHEKLGGYSIGTLAKYVKQ